MVFEDLFHKWCPLQLYVRVFSFSVAMSVQCTRSASSVTSSSLRVQATWKGAGAPLDREIPFRIEIPRKGVRNPGKDAIKQVGMTIIKRETCDRDDGPHPRMWCLCSPLWWSGEPVGPFTTLKRVNPNKQAMLIYWLQNKQLTLLIWEGIKEVLTSHYFIH
jgi:hypothetical protein